MSAVGLALGGDREGGRSALLACWRETGDAEQAQQCVVAHYIADLEDRLNDEVAWDERALLAYKHVGREDLAAVGIPDAAGLAPSLHLNLGDGYLRQGRPSEALVQWEAALDVQHVLGDDGYANMIRNGLAALEAKLNALTG
ncbi:hypothetical protein SAMN06264364_1422 [Quadrisphaera granulorum]|uniref:Tetratricopeptide repeat protein n=2 Tax=Quadrisphaera granulorum TaxID=317664 RepID=A0A315ZPW0_9ACTN|nr:hypothetical protein BXY45_1422 [Quadrisphaera granulorum]SZE98941.1 hypothetical protein SAMN06264364_1422 [Quadrisphaera granulorum]